MKHYTRRKINIIISIGIAFLYFIVNIKLISNGHFEEDAYILFIYVENLVNGEGIVYYPGGPHAEGATDFLWLILLAILGKLGLDTGTSVILLNAVGVFIITFLLSNELSDSKIKDKTLLFCLSPFLVLWIVYPPLSAALGGFSVFLYISFILFVIVIVHKETHITYTPYLSLLIALFRPDGVIIGVFATLVGLWKIYTNSHRMRQYLIGMVICFLIGTSYFIWRYNYFGNLLPLPLYVKKHGSSIAGLYANFSWIKRHCFFLVPVIALAFFHKKIKYILLITLPIGVHFLSLISATQSQNIGQRFHAPEFIIAYYILFILLIEYVEKQSPSKLMKYGFLVYLLILAIMPSQSFFRKGKHAGSAIVGFHYAHQVLLPIGRLLPVRSTIVLTEAGRMAYWDQKNGHEIIDIVGLNTEFPAKNTISIIYLEQLQPDMLMYHHSQMVNTQWISHSNENLVPLTEKDKKFLVSKKVYSDVERKQLSKVENAAVVATQYLQKYFNDYDIFIVDSKGDKRFQIIYAFRKTLKLKDRIHSVLKESFQKNTKLSYYEMLDKRNAR